MPVEKKNLHHFIRKLKADTHDWNIFCNLCLFRGDIQHVVWERFFPKKMQLAKTQIYTCIQPLTSYSKTFMCHYTKMYILTNRPCEN